MARMGKIRNAHRILVGKRVGKQGHLKTEKECDDRKKMDLRKMG